MPATEEQWLLVQALGGLAVTSVFTMARAQEAGAVADEEEEEEELQEVIVDATGEAQTEEVDMDAAGSAGAAGQTAEEVSPEQLEAVRDACMCYCACVSAIPSQCQIPVCARANMSLIAPPHAPHPPFMCSNNVSSMIS